MINLQCFYLPVNIECLIAVPVTSRPVTAVVISSMKTV